MNSPGFLCARGARDWWVAAGWGRWRAQGLRAFSGGGAINATNPLPRALGFGRMYAGMKDHLRTEMKAALVGIKAEDAAEMSRAACESLLALDEYARARSVMLYAPIAGEVDCRPIAVAAWKDGKTVLLPRVTWVERHMVAVPVDSLNHPVVTGRNGLREPEGEPWPIERIGLIVVPALAYDRLGNRLGRGGGFYDRFLARGSLAARACGLAFSIQVVGELPVHPNDYPVKVLVTDKEVLRFTNGIPTR